MKPYGFENERPGQRYKWADVQDIRELALPTRYGKSRSGGKRITRRARKKAARGAAKRYIGNTYRTEPVDRLIATNESFFPPGG